MLDREPIKRLIAVEGSDDPIAVCPDFPVVVDVNAVRVGITSGIQPIAATVFAPTPEWSALQKEIAKLKRKLK